MNGILVGKQNHIILIPRTAPYIAPRHSVAKNLWRTAGDRHFLKLSSSEKGNEAAIWGPKRIGAHAFGARDYLCRKRINRPEPQTCNSRRHCGKRHVTAVRGNGRPG